MELPEKSGPCSNVLLHLDCCAVRLASEEDPHALGKRLGEAIRTGEVIKVRICVEGRPVDAWVRPSNTHICYIGDPDVRLT